MIQRTYTTKVTDFHSPGIDLGDKCSVLWTMMMIESTWGVASFMITVDKVTLKRSGVDLENVRLIANYSSLDLSSGEAVRPISVEVYTNDDNTIKEIEVVF